MISTDDLQLSLSDFNEALRSTVVQWAMEFDKTESTSLRELIKQILIINIKPQQPPVSDPRDIIRINKAAIIELMKPQPPSKRLKWPTLQPQQQPQQQQNALTSDDLLSPDLIHQIEGELKKIQVKIDDMKKNFGDKSTFINRFGAITYLFKVLVLVSIFISILIVIRSTQNAPAPAPTQESHSEVAQLKEKLAFVSEKLQQTLIEMQKNQEAYQNLKSNTNANASGYKNAIQLQAARLNDFQKEVNDLNNIIGVKREQIITLSADQEKLTSASDQLIESLTQQNERLKQENESLKRFKDAYEALSKLAPQMLQYSID